MLPLAGEDRAGAAAVPGAAAAQQGWGGLRGPSAGRPWGRSAGRVVAGPAGSKVQADRFRTSLAIVESCMYDVPS